MNITIGGLTIGQNYSLYLYGYNASGYAAGFTVSGTSYLLRQPGDTADGHNGSTFDYTQFHSETASTAAGFDVAYYGNYLLLDFIPTDGTLTISLKTTPLPPTTNWGMSGISALQLYTVTPVPEPSALALTLGGAALLALLRRRR